MAHSGHDRSAPGHGYNPHGISADISSHLHRWARHPDDVYDYPEWMGSSIGHWEGDTLVVDTVSINDKTWLDTSVTSTAIS